MDINQNKIDYVANLSRITLTAEEKTVFRKQLNDILEYIETLNELDTEEIHPMAYATSLKNVFREDKITSSLTRQEILKLSPSHSNGFFKVPKVIE